MHCKRLSPRKNPNDPPTSLVIRDLCIEDKVKWLLNPVTYQWFKRVHDLFIGEHNFVKLKWNLSCQKCYDFHRYGSVKLTYYNRMELRMCCGNELLDVARLAHCKLRRRDESPTRRNQASSYPRRTHTRSLFFVNSHEWEDFHKLPNPWCYSLYY